MKATASLQSCLEVLIGTLPMSNGLVGVHGCFKLLEDAVNVLLTLHLCDLLA